MGYSDELHRQRELPAAKVANSTDRVTDLCCLFNPGIKCESILVYLEVERRNGRCSVWEDFDHLDNFGYVHLLLTFNSKPVPFRRGARLRLSAEFARRSCSHRSSFFFAHSASPRRKERRVQQPVQGYGQIRRAQLRYPSEAITPQNRRRMDVLPVSHFRSFLLSTTNVRRSATHRMFRINVRRFSPDKTSPCSHREIRSTH